MDSARKVMDLIDDLRCYISDIERSYEGQDNRIIVVQNRAIAIFEKAIVMLSDAYANAEDEKELEEVIDYVTKRSVDFRKEALTKIISLGGKPSTNKENKKEDISRLATMLRPFSYDDDSKKEIQTAASKETAKNSLREWLG